MQPPAPPGDGDRQEISRRRHRALLELAALDKSDFEEVLRRVLEADAEALEVERVNCWTFEPEPPAIRCIAAHLRSSGPVANGMVLRGDDYPQYFRALSEDPLILAHDARSDPRTNEFRDDYLVPNGIASMMDVPIWVRGRLWGVVCHEHVGSPRRWHEDERNFGISIGHVLSMAVEARERVEAERIVQLNEFFIGVLSHDLRGPLSTVLASAEGLLLRDPTPDTAEAAARILRSTEQMTRMVEQLLDFTRARLGTGLPIQSGPTDLAEIARRVASDLALTTAGRTVDIQVAGDPVGEWDADRLWQMLSNLISNAYRHGSRETPIWARIDGSAPHEVILHIGNHGEIAEELGRVIFDPFRRITPSARKGGGLGLGLYITREIVKAHRGVITVNTGGGETVFTVILPRRDAELPGAPAAC